MEWRESQSEKWKSGDIVLLGITIYQWNVIHFHLDSVCLTKQQWQLLIKLYPCRSISMYLIKTVMVQGCHPPTWKTWNFVIFFSRPGKCLEFAQKVVKTWNFNSKPGKNMKFANSIFQASLFKMSFTKIILIYFFVISTLSTQTLIRIQINLGFHCF